MCKKRNPFLLILSLVVCALQTVPLDAGDIEESVVRGIYGTRHQFREFKEASTKAIVVVFLDPHCPVVQQYTPKLRKLYSQYNGYEKDRTGSPVRIDTSGRERTYKYAGDRVCFLGVYPAVDFSINDMAAHALDVEFPFRVLHDEQQQLMRALGVTELAEVAVLDRDFKVQYQGTIDDMFFPGGSKKRATKHYLKNAIDTVLAGKQVAIAKRPPQGCRITKYDPNREHQKVTFHKDVERILQRKCQECHRPGEVGPMPFVEYQDVYDYGEMIEQVILDKRMPPWPGRSARKFLDDHRLTVEEKSVLLNWIRSGMAKGNSSDGPQPLVWSRSTEWKIGKPDFVFKMPKPFKVPATGTINYVYYPIKANFPTDKYIKAIETAPGNPEVVHHIQVHEYWGKPKSEASGLSILEQMYLYGPSIEGAKLLGGYTPGNNANARVYDSAAGMKLTRGANLVFELHYTPNGKAATDQSRVGIVFTDEKPEKELQTHFYFRKRGDFVIPANVQHHTMQHLYHFDHPVRIYGFRPHMHSRGKSYRLELVDSKDVRLKDIHDVDSHGKRRGELLFTIPVWDFNWQLTYEFEKPLIVPKGKALLATGYWDNTVHNPRNPNAEDDVLWGQQTEQEMFNTLFIYEELEPNHPLLRPEK